MLRFYFTCLLFVMSLMPVYAAQSCKAMLTPNADLPSETISSLVLLSPSFLKQHGQALFFNSQSPTIGNPKGDVTVVDFFDYQCGYCKRVSPVLANLAQ